MGLPSFYTVFFLLIIASSSFDIVYGQKDTLNILDFDAVGDGVADDSQAFLKAWNTLCASGQVLNIPAEKTFLVKPLHFQGPCKLNNTIIHIDGNVVGPSTLDEWSKWCKTGHWLYFKNVNGLVIKGEGTFNGQGSVWWNHKHLSINETNATSCVAPPALHFDTCDQLELDGFTCRDSPRVHILVQNCKSVQISNINVNASLNSPNTDGISIAQSNQVTIKNSVIGTGDDCIAIKGGSSYVNISNVTCGPGHGFSVGSLGQNPAAIDQVEQVYVQNCVCNKTMNCARIKTWMGGSGYAKDIFFEQMTLYEAGHPIIIDQHYCNGKHNCENKPGAVNIRDVSFSDFTGTSASELAITLNCSDFGCSNIFMDHINLTSAMPEKLNLQSFCNNASGMASSTTPTIPCLSSEPSPPTTAPSIAPRIAPISLPF